MRPIATAVLACLALAPAVAGAETWNRSFPAGRQAAVRIRTDDARVTVRAREGRTIDVRVSTAGQVKGLYVGKSRPHVEIEQVGDVVHVEARLVGSRAGFVVVSTIRLVVEVDVPPECDLDLDSSDGSSIVEGLEGRVSVRSSDGRVTLRELTGDVVVHTNDGSLLAEGLDGRLTGTTTDGTLRVSGRFDDLDLETHDGDMTVDVEPGSRVTSGWSFRTTDGGLDLSLPRELRATLDASVRDGSLDIDLPSQRWESTRARAVRVDLNGGGPELKVRAADGSVRIRGRS